MVVIDQFLDNYQQLKDYSLSCEFKDEKNPADGVVYPLICKDIPKEVRKELFDRLSQIKGAEIENETLFLRQSPEGVDVPHQAHTDRVMGKYSFMLYLNKKGGTSFLRHLKTGICYHPKHEALEQLIREDQNKLGEWQIINIAEARENRGVIFDAEQIHRAEPVGGFGQGREARCVLTCFFS